MGVPGCPEFACWTASIDSVRIVLIASVSSGSAAEATGCLRFIEDVMGLSTPVMLSSCNWCGFNGQPLGWLDHAVAPCGDEGRHWQVSRRSERSLAARPD